MSDEGSHGNLWGGSHSCGFSNSDDSVGGTEKFSLKPPNSSSYNSPMRKAAATVSAAGQKRGRKELASSGKAGGGDGGGAESDHEVHIWTERERRKKMRNMFAGLHALLPQLPPKSDKSTIVDEAVNYIKTLQDTLQVLQKKRLDRFRSATTLDLEPSTITCQNKPFEQKQAFLAADHHQGSSKEFLLVDSNMPHTLSSLPRPTPPMYPACFQTWFSPNVVISICGNDAQISVCSSKKQGILATIFYILDKHRLEVLSAHVSSDHYHSMYMIHAHAVGSCDHHLEKLTVEERFKLAVGEMIFLILSC